MAARNTLGLTDEQFFSLTPRQFYWLLDDRRQFELDQWRHDEKMTGILAQHIVNFSMGHPERPVGPDSFDLPLLRATVKAKRETAKQKADRRKQISGDMRSFFTDLRKKFRT